MTKTYTIPMLATVVLLALGCGGSNPSDQRLTLETLCGTGGVQGQEMKIVGGRECGAPNGTAPNGTAPNGTVVKLLLLDDEDNQTICSGVRLDATTVLTAAHCLNEFVFSVSVELASGERVVPTKIAIHPEARNLGSLFINDAAILTISPPAGEIPPPTVRIAESVEAGDTLTILGYGATSGASPIGSGVLRVGEMRVNEVTTDSIFSDYTPPTPSNTCFGDSGGPAFVDDGDGGLVLAGITSTGTDIMCAVGDRSAFTNLTNQAMRVFVEEGSVTMTDDGA